jgi:NADPH-dependent 2,4-dienoyl-CoA reductase/sulfur reductase-like enzyme
MIFGIFKEELEMRFLIIGGDAAGMSAASRARRNDPSLDITVLERTADVSYSACGMPYNIADPSNPMDALVVRRAEVFREKQGINLLTGHEARTIDPAARRVSGVTEGGQPFTLAYDRLLIATGARALTLDVPGADAPGVMALKSLRDGRAMKAWIETREVRHALILGIGYIGLEMAEAFRARGVAVTMIKPRPGFLPWLEEELADVVQQEVEANQVALRLGPVLHRIEPGGRLTAVFDTMTADADIILPAIGVTPNSEIAAAAGIALGPGRAIAVDRQMRTSAEAVYAAGDCADAYHMVTGERAWVPLALRANRAGWAAADHVCGQPVELPGITGTAVFKVFGLQVARTGLNVEEARRAGFDPVKAVVTSRSRAHAQAGSSPVYVQMVGDGISGRLLGAQMVGREGVAHRINAAATALFARMTVENFSQCDLAYAPPFSPVWDPLLTAANQLKKLL